LLETTRAYSLEKLIEAGEFDAAARRHAGRYLDIFERAVAEAETRPTDEWLADYGPRIDNLRSALDWAFSSSGDPSIGVALTIAAVPLWLQLSLMEECRERVERALASIGLGSNRQHYLGDQVGARYHIERMLARSTPSTDRVRLYRFQFDQSSAARCILAHVLWLQGFPEQAIRTAQDSVDGARASNHALSLCNALAQAACPTALFVGDLVAAGRFIAMLTEHSERHLLLVWEIWARCLQGVLLIRRGEVVTGLPLLRAALEELRRTGYVLRYTGLLGAFAEGLGDAGQVTEGLAAVDDALERSDRNDARWCMAELLRVKGDLLRLQGAPNAAADLFCQALHWARRQGALSWELRAVTSLARLLSDQGRSAEARAHLQPIYDRFTEGFATADLKTAKVLLDDLS